MAKKKNKGQINFFRVMAVIGVVIIILVVKEFLNAAPAHYPAAKSTRGPPPAKACLECHVKEAENTPIMPHRPMSSCIICHEPSEKNG